MSTILFSGRFDKPHLGHLITIQRLMRQFTHVIVAILDYPEQKFPMARRIEAMGNALSGSIGSWEIVISPHHFAKITCGQLKEDMPHFDIYGTGNREVLEHIEKQIGSHKVMYVPRYPGYAASKEEV